MKRFLVFLFLVVCVCAFTQLWNPMREGFFYSPPSFSDCRAQGYTKEFCLQTPVSVLGPNACQCPLGEVGMVIPGFRGECICGPAIAPWL
jgi:hypothetical protein